MAGVSEKILERVRRIETGEIPVVGVNCLTESAESPLVRTLDGEANILVVDPAAELEQQERLSAWREERDPAAVERGLAELRDAAAADINLVPPSIALARAGGTVGEWAGVLREVFGEYRGPTGVGSAPAGDPGDLAALSLRFWPSDPADIQKVSEAIPALAAFVAAHPESAGARRSLARAELVAGRIDDALAGFAAAVALAPGDDDLRAEYWTELGKQQR